jgi:hypothetical protein
MGIFRTMIDDHVVAIATNLTVTMLRASSPIMAEIESKAS